MPAPTRSGQQRHGLILIGRIDDMTVTKTDSVLNIVLSVGGFLGMGKRYVVAANSLEVINKQMVFAGGTKE
jgi:hypothetical protein